MWTQLERRETALEQVRSDAAIARRQHQTAVEENGRLETRLDAFSFSAQARRDDVTGVELTTTTTTI